MKVYIRVEKQNPKATGAECYSEHWDVETIESLNSFNIHALQSIEFEVVGHIRKNGTFEQECIELDELNRLRTTLINRQSSKQPFQFDAGDYVYTITLTGGLSQYVQ